MAAIWAGIGAGKTHHHCVAIQERAASGCRRDASPTTSPLHQLLSDGQPLGDEVAWGIDLADGGTALAIAPTHRR
jgi:hypothetical protein